MKGGYIDSCVKTGCAWYSLQIDLSLFWLRLTLSLQKTLYCLCKLFLLRSILKRDLVKRTAHVKKVCFLWKKAWNVQIQTVVASCPTAYKHMHAKSLCSLCLDALILLFWGQGVGEWSVHGLNPSPLSCSVLFGLCHDYDMGVKQNCCHFDFEWPAPKGGHVRQVVLVMRDRWSLISLVSVSCS